MDRVVSLLGVRIHNPELESFLHILREHVVHSRQESAETKTLHIGFANAHCLNVAWTDPAYRACMERMDWVLPDGIGVRLGCQLSSQPAVRNLNGTDLFPVLCETAQAEDWSFYLLGGEPGIAERMAERTRERYPRLQIRGWNHGYFTEREEPALLESIRTLRPDILFVALGAPRQDIWIAKNLENLGIAAAFGVGGLFDFVSGRRGRAPAWIRGIGLEWLFRLALEPRRLMRRYILGNPLFLYRVWRWGTKSRQSPVPVDAAGDERSR